MWIVCYKKEDLNGNNPYHINSNFITKICLNNNEIWCSNEEFWMDPNEYDKVLNLLGETKLDN